MRNKTLSRRTVLRGLSVSLALPCLEVMGPVVRASRQPLATPLRMMFFSIPNGAHMPAWTPEATGVDYALSPILQPLAKHRDSVSVLSGLALDGAHAHGDGAGDHARSGASFLTGAHPRKTDGADIRNGISVDQVAAQAIGKQTRFASLELGLEGSAQAGNCDSGYSCAYSSNLAWRSETSPLAKEIDPAAVFDRLFGAPDASGGAARDRSAKWAKRKSILDFVLEDAKQLQGKLGNADKQKLDEYLYSVRDVESRMVQADKLKIGEDGVPNYPRPAGVPRQWETHCRLMMDMITLAIRSDSTRVLSFMLANEGSNRGYPDIGAPEGHHDLSHHGKSPEKQTKVEKINVHHMTQFAYLIDSLSQIREGEGSLLDQCMIMYGSGISDGDRHNHDELPIILVGKAGGAIPQGLHRKYAKGTPLCNLYVWMLNRMGVATSSFGDSQGELAI